MTIGENIEARERETNPRFIEFVSEDGRFLGNFDIKFKSLVLHTGVTDEQATAIKIYARRRGWKEGIWER